MASNQKELWLAYVLACACFVTPFAGLHRFYLNRNASALLYLFTWGFFGVGTVIDLIRMGDMVHAETHKALQAEKKYAQRALPNPDKPAKPAKPTKKDNERRILEIARANNGHVTAALVSLESHMNLKDARKALDHLCEEGFCERDINEEGADLYVFKGLRSTEPLNVD